ncbi:MMPL family transporter [Nocardioides sp. J2M5]|uniref:MMPL family transporter n=1 Tax=Nocardioides palaemonis TaxID=2829810 RepID=UPI001BAB94EB|nr:MMPL family transporter [Nocardioides palaemonis]MBS2939232.1 MMPL family transporter [Nocardioides palaemonis]
MNRQIAGVLTGRVTKWGVLVVWLVIAGGSAMFASKLADVQNNEMASWLPANAESTRAFEKLAPFQDADDIPTTVVYHRSSGLTDDDLAAIEEQAGELAGLDGVPDTLTNGSPPVVSPAVAAQVAEATGQPATGVSADGTVAQTVVTFNFGAEGWNELPAAADEIRDIARIDGVDVHIAGAGGQAADSAEAFGGIDSTLLGATLLVVIVILLFTYRSPLLWILPIFTALVGLFTTEAVVYFLAKDAGLTVNGQSQGILTVLVIGAGTDYALLLVARYREELRRHADRHEAMAFALHRAAPAILASAATVVIGMLCLTFAEMNSTAGLGPVNAVGIAITFLAMVTLLPALLVICGRWIFWPRRPGFGSQEPTAAGLWARVGRWIAPRARMVWVGTTAALLVACLGIFQLDATGLSSEEQYTKDFDSLVGQRVLAAAGMVDTSNPVMVVTDAEQAPAVAEALRGVDGIGDVVGDVPPVDGVALVTGALTTDVAAQASFDTVQRVRDAVGEVDGAGALVGGTSAMFYDIEQASQRDNTVIIPMVLVVVMLILMLLLRALVAPLLLMATVVLSFGAALGLSALIFQYVFGFDHADASFPLFVFVFLVALGIDYNIFLMTRVREETVNHGTRRGSLVALAATGGVITSAGLVLAATFTVLGTLPLVFLAQMGTAVALGVLLDTMIVRSVLVTALNLDLGAKIWWPSRLDADDRHLTAAEAEQPLETVH